MKHKIRILLFIISSLALSSQEKLTLSEAISIALKSNYRIIISKNNAEIADNNLTAGNAGFLPSIDVSAGQNYSVNNSNKTYQNGNTSIVDGAEASVFTANASLDWVLFDGMKMFTSYEQLSELKAMSDAELRSNIESVIYSVMSNYYMLVRQKNIVAVNRENLDLSKERLRVINEKFNVGSSSKLDVLNAQVDYNADYTNLKTQEDLFYNLKVSLNELLAREKQTDFDVEDSVAVAQDLNLQSLENRMLKSNPDLLAAEKNMKVMSLSSKIYQSEYYPMLGFSADYNYIKSRDNAGFLSRNINSGFSIGLNVTMNLFDGLNTSRKIENSKVGEMTAKTAYDELKNNLVSSLNRAYNSYKSNLEISELERQNIEVARENFEISQEKLKLGSFSQIEFREAQKNYITALSRYVLALNAAKLSELELLRICGIITGK